MAFSCKLTPLVFAENEQLIVIIFRYFAKEVYMTVFSVTLVLVFMFLADQVARYLGRAASGDIPLSVVLGLISIELPYLLGLLLPLGFYLGVLIACGRFYADHEMLVLFSSGMSRLQLAKMTVYLGVGVSFLVAFLMFVLNPLLELQKKKVLDSTVVAHMVSTLMPGEFKISQGGKKVVYVAGVTVDHQKATQVFMAEQTEDSAAWAITSAKTAYVMEADQADTEFVVAEDGYRYQGEPGRRDFTVTQFARYGVKLVRKNSAIQLAPKDTDAMSTLFLWLHRDDNIRYLVELHWRFALPVSCILFGIIGMQLSETRPREGRFKRFVPAVLVYVVYVNLMFIARDWMKNGVTPPVLGFWWVQCFLLVIIGLLALRQRWQS